MVPPTPGYSSHLSSCNQGNLSQTCWETHLSASSIPSTMWECWIWNQQEIIFCKQVVIGLIKMRRATLNVCNIFWVRPISNKEVWVKGFAFCMLPIACQWDGCSADVTALHRHCPAPSLPCTVTALRCRHCPSVCCHYNPPLKTSSSWGSSRLSILGWDCWGLQSSGQSSYQLLSLYSLDIVILFSLSHKTI